MNLFEEEKRCNFFQNKWSKMKHLFQEKVSLLTSINIFKEKKINSNIDVCLKFFLNEILMHKFMEINSKIISSGKKSMPYSIPHINISEAKTNLIYFPEVSKFLFTIRNNNSLMIKIIENIPKKQFPFLVSLICHFFYENIYSESTEQQELLYLIYLLFEKEISAMNSISYNSFLSDSFLGKLLFQLQLNHETISYIDSTIYSLIRKFEKTHYDYFSFEIFENSESEKKYKNSRTMDETNHTELNVNVGQKELIKIINDPKISEIKKNLALKMLNFIQIKGKNKENEDILSTANSIARLNNIYSDTDQLDEILNSFYCAYDNTSNFILSLFKKLQNTNIIPYNIKCICRIIYDLIQKKFKNISELDKNCFVTKFFFTKLIFPVLINPDSGILSSEILISKTTRKSMFNVYVVLKKFIEGEFFTNESNISLVIFNNFFLTNIDLIKDFVNKVIDVKLPSKIENLIEQFYNNENNYSRIEEPKLTNYFYFEENTDDFLSNQTICISTEELYYLISAAEKTDYFSSDKCDPKVSESFNKISSFKDTFHSKYKKDIEKKVMNYYVFIKDEYKEEIINILNKKEDEVMFPQQFNPETNLIQIKQCISKVLSNINFFANSEWSSTNSTITCFQKIYDYLSKKKEDKVIPLSWYCLYLIENLPKLKTEQSDNDYNNLYEEIHSETVMAISFLKKYLDFFTTKMSGKANILEDKLSSYHDDLRQVIKSQIFIKIFFFIMDESSSVYVDDYITEPVGGEKKYIDRKPLIKFNCNGIDDFIESFSRSECIYEQIEKKVDKDEDKIGMNILNNYMEYIGQVIEKTKYMINFFGKDEESKKHLTIDQPEILEIINSSQTIDQLYTNIKNFLDLNEEDSNGENNKFICNEIIQDILNDLFGDSSENGQGNEIKIEKVMENMKNKIKSIIWNYVLKALVYQNSYQMPIKEDENFFNICQDLLNEKKIDPVKDLKIPKEFVNQKLLNGIIKHLKRMEKYLSPQDKLDEFSAAIKKITSLFLFTMKKDRPEAGDLLPVIFYILLSAQPKRIIWTCNFLNYFLTMSQKMGAEGYNITQIESAIMWVKNLQIKTEK